MCYFTRTLGWWNDSFVDKESIVIGWSLSFACDFMVKMVIAAMHRNDLFLFTFPFVAKLIFLTHVLVLPVFCAYTINAFLPPTTKPQRFWKSLAYACSMNLIFSITLQDWPIMVKWEVLESLQVFEEWTRTGLAHRWHIWRSKQTYR